MPTKKQKRFYDTLKEMAEREGYFPSVREIGAEMGLTSSATVHGYLARLRRNGWLAREGKSWRFAREGPGVPLMGVVPAGSPREVFRDLGEEVEVPAFMSGTGKGELMAFRVTGDSMKDAYIQEGDIVVLRRTAEAEPGRMVIALLPDSTITLKRLALKGGVHCLVPDNPDYETIRGPFRLVGRVVGVIRRYR